MDKKILIEYWRGGTKPQVIEVLFPTEQQLRDMISSMYDEESSTLEIRVNDKVLLVNSSNSVYTITALLGEDEFYDLVGDSSVVGTETFILGGQTDDYPCKNLIRDLDFVTEISINFLKSGTIDPNKYNWEMQK